MNVLTACLLTLAFSYNTLGDHKVRYDGFKVYRLTPRSKEAAEALKALEASNSGYDFWTSVRGVGYPVDVMVPPHFKDLFNETIGVAGLDAEVFIPDVQKLIDKERPKSSRASGLEWTDYHTLQEINQFLITLVAQFPNQVSLVTAGRTYEGRDILGVKVSFKPGNEARTVFLESNIHAREWITSAVSTWILNQLLTSTDANVRQVADSHDWYVVPVFNPDEFEYTHTKDRAWRKTRTPHYFCVGVDPNRNWAYQYNQGGTSVNPCSNTYRGPNAFSESSTRTLSEFISTIGPKLQAYIGLHSYGQQILIPYGHSSKHQDNYEELYKVGQQAVASIARRYGTEYEAGNIVDILYVASGSSMDWAKGTFGTRITYTFELRDKGQYGFVLPASQIIPCAEETLDAIITIFQEFDKL